MRVVIQRVNHASVTVENKVISAIKTGLLILVGIENADTEEDIEWLSNKITQLRIFDDKDGVMNLSVKDVDGEILAISQFTLHAKTKKGNRPSYQQAAKPEVSVPLYKQFIEQLGKDLGKDIKTGEFGAYMKVALENDGPVTIMIDSKNKT
jgi:D-tyrosyl-tRNA(Tyr) deacylase